MLNFSTPNASFSTFDPEDEFGAVYSILPHSSDAMNQPPTQSWIEQAGAVPSRSVSRQGQKKKAIVPSLLNNTIPTTFLLEFELILLAFSTGIQDATTFPDYGCFASNQTGNTILLSIGLLGLATGESVSRSSKTGPDDNDGRALLSPLGGVSLTDIGTSLAFFVSGVLISGQIANLLGCWRRRWWLLFSSTVQTLLVFAAAALTSQLALPSVTRQSSSDAAVIAFLAFSSGAQVSMARALEVPEITTAMATAAYVDLFIDRKLFVGIRENRGRNRRIVFLVALVVGSLIGAALYRLGGSSLTLMTSAIVKMVVTCMLMVNRGTGGVEEGFIMDRKRRLEEV